MEQFHCVEDEGGESVVIYRDLGKLSDQLVNVAPRDRERIKRFIGILEDFGRFRPPVESAPETAGLMEGLAAAWAMRPVAKHFAMHWKKPLAQWLDSFESPILKKTFLKIYPIPGFPVLAMFSAMGWFAGGQVGCPDEGSREIVEAVSAAYLGLDGEMRCASPVERILVEAGRAAGVRLADGSEHRAEIVLGAADGHATIFKLLGGRFIDETVRGYYRDLALFTPLLGIHFGAEREISEDPSCIHFPLKKPIDIFGSPVANLNLHHSAGRGGAAPPGHSVIRIGIETPYEPWEELARTPDRYGEEKNRIAGEVLERLDDRYPGLARSVKVRDVATPVTMVRYTGNWKGSYEGWQPTTRTFGLRMRRTLPGLRGFYMAGQWVEPGGGIPGVLRSARNAVKLICSHYGKKFVPG
jgi:phytoene dehydrogenase-like protein